MGGRSSGAGGGGGSGSSSTQSRNTKEINASNVMSSVDSLVAEKGNYVHISDIADNLNLSYSVANRDKLWDVIYGQVRQDKLDVGARQEAMSDNRTRWERPGVGMLGGDAFISKTDVAFFF